MDLSKDLLLFLQFEIEFVVKSNKSLAENKIKNKTEQLFLKYKLETMFMNTESSKRDKQHKFVLNLSQRLDLKSLNKHV